LLRAGLHNSDGSAHSGKRVACSLPSFDGPRSHSSVALRSIQTLAQQTFYISMTQVIIASARLFPHWDNARMHLVQARGSLNHST
jgi:hypothetical protein